MTWIERCSYADPNAACQNLLGEDERGDLWVPSRRQHDRWERLNLRDVMHWSYWLRSRLRRRIVHLERLDAAS